MSSRAGAGVQLELARSPVGSLFATEIHGDKSRAGWVRALERAGAVEIIQPPADCVPAEHVGPSGHALAQYWITVRATPSVPEQGILFSAPMVRAILANTKTQTRRGIAGARGAFWERSYTGTVERDGVLRLREGADGTIVRGSPEVRCRYGAVGHRLWVKETWRVDDPSTGEIGYRASPGALGSCASRMHDTSDAEWWAHWSKRSAGGRWQPSIYMPRWASRILLEIVSVRVERLQDISEDDARAEGLARVTKDGGATVKYGIADRDGLPGTDDDGWPWAEWSADPREAYRNLWDRLNGERAGFAWRDNPWVWVVTTKRCER